jgi:hypothetical protein
VSFSRERLWRIEIAERGITELSMVTMYIEALMACFGKPHSGFTWLTAARFKGGNRGIR